MDYSKRNLKSELLRARHYIKYAVVRSAGGYYNTIHNLSSDLLNTENRLDSLRAYDENDFKNVELLLSEIRQYPSRMGAAVTSFEDLSTHIKNLYGLSQDAEIDPFENEESDNILGNPHPSAEISRYLQSQLEELISKTVNTIYGSVSGAASARIFDKTLSSAFDKFYIRLRNSNNLGDIEDSELGFLLDLK